MRIKLEIEFDTEVISSHNAVDLVRDAADLMVRVDGVVACTVMRVEDSDDNKI